MSWSSEDCEGGTIHVVPKDDLKEHKLNSRCPCGPCQDEEVENMWVHNAFDRRELYEGKVH